MSALQSTLSIIVQILLLPELSLLQTAEYWTTCTSISLLVHLYFTFVMA